MYHKASYQIKHNSELSDSFPSFTGVRQGDNLSPLLFSLFINDLCEHLSNSYCGLSILTDIIHKSLDDDIVEFYLRLYLLLYADDTLILAESPSELQAALDSMQTYCENWDLMVNTDKTKVCIFSKSREESANFLFNSKPIEVVKSFTYLGVVFSYNSNFKCNTDYLLHQGQRAKFSLLQKVRHLSLSPSISYDLFLKSVVPVLLYGCEVWGFNSFQTIEVLHLSFLKSILNVRKSTANCMVYGELGAFPLNISCKSRMVTFWHKLHTDRSDKLSGLIYRVLRQLYLKNCNLPWLKFVQATLNNCGLSYIWDTPYVCSTRQLNVLLKSSLEDQFKQMWFGEIDQKSSCYVL